MNASYEEDDLIEYSDDDTVMVDAKEAKPEPVKPDDQILPIRAHMDDGFVDLTIPKNTGGIRLPYTLPTYLGMVISNGRPQYRPFFEETYRFRGPNPNPEADRALEQYLRMPEIDIRTKGLKFPNLDGLHKFEKYDPPAAVIDVAIECIRSKRRPHMNEESEQYAKYARNLQACQVGLRKRDMVAYVQWKQRVDLEQAAAAVVSALYQEGRVDDTTSLVKELGHLLPSCCMWLSQSDVPALKGKALGVSHFGEDLQKFALAADVAVPAMVSLKEILPFLLRVRRVAPRDRCLCIPKWIFDEAKMEPPEPFRRFFTEMSQSSSVGPSLSNRVYPTAVPRSDSIFLSRNSFRTIQRRMFALFRFWAPANRLQYDIKKLESRILFPSEWIEERMASSQDVAAVSYYFFMFQRRMQKKVVGWSSWHGSFGATPSGFLKKGEGRTYYQNNLGIQSSFEQALRRIAGLENEPLNFGDGDTVDLIDKTCLLMKEYVDIHGNGDKSKLVFVKGVRGGATRGPVDNYNLLCDMLHVLKERAKDEHILDVPGPVHKFLAKDIMSWNQSWGDDAFAGGKIPGWESWLKNKRLM